MEGLLKEFLAVVPPWVHIGIGIAVLALAIGLVILVWNSTRQTLNNANRAHIEKKLEERCSNLEKEKEKLEYEVACLEGSLRSAKNYSKFYVEAMNETKSEDHYKELIQKIIESICNDIKMTPKSVHRSALWIYYEEEDSQLLQLYGASSGFAVNGINNKKLDVNDSIAGRSFRKRKIEVVNNVVEDPDWEYKENKKYEAILCCPVGDYGVVTVDSKMQITDQLIAIVELYSILIEGIFDELQRVYIENQDL